MAIAKTAFTLLSALILPSVVLAQDECATATPILDGLTAGTNIGATTSAPTGSCGFIGHD